MAHIVTDRVRETTTTTSTGAIALGGAVSGYQDFDSQMANADTTAYAIEHRTANEWEVGLGTWNTGNTLSRTTIIRSSNSNAVVNLSGGTKDVFMTFTPSVRQPGMAWTGALTPATNDLAALGSANFSWADLFLATGGVINWNNGDATITNNNNQIILGGGGVGTLVTDAGSATDPPILITAGTLMTTPSDGAIEADATNFYGTTDAGNRGYIPNKHMLRQNAARTYTSNTNAQNVFDTPANGRITLETGIYRFHAILSFGSMSATSGNRSLNLLGGGSATVTSWMWVIGGVDASTATAAAGGFSHQVTSTTAASAIPAATGTSLGVLADGVFNVTVAGTVQPQTTMVTAAASTLTIGSFLEIWRVGPTGGFAGIGQVD